MLERQSSDPYRRWLPWLLRLIGPVLLVFFLLTSDIPTLLMILRQAALPPIIISLLLMPPFLLAKSWRWRILLRESGVVLSWVSALGIYTVSVFLGSVTPGQSGDLIKAWYVQQRGHPFAPALLCTMIDRLCDLLVMSIIALSGLFMIGQLLPSPFLRILLVLGMSMGLVFMTVFLIVPRLRNWFLTRGLPRILPTRLHHMLQRWSTELSTLQLSWHLGVILLLLSLLSATMTFLRLWLLFLSLEVFLPWWLVVGTSALIAVLQVLPISIAGMGVRDGVLIAMLSAYGYDRERALALSALFLLLTLQQIAVGFLVSWWYPFANGHAPQPPTSP